MSKYSAEEERAILGNYFTNLDSDVFCLINLPEVVKGALFAKYSRAPQGIRRLFLDQFYIPRMTSGGLECSLADYAAQKGVDFFDKFVDGFGHKSVCKLGSAHIAVENISMLATKALEDCRLGGAYLEKSSRYVPFDQLVDGEYNFCREPVLCASEFKDDYMSLNHDLFAVYSMFLPLMQEYYSSIMPKKEGQKESAYKSAIRSRACDAVRGLLPVSAMTNMGVHANGLCFEEMLKKLYIHPLAEVRDIGEKMRLELDKVIPAFIRSANPSHRHFNSFVDYRASIDSAIRRFTPRFSDNFPLVGSDEVTLVCYDKDLTNALALMLYDQTEHPLSSLHEFVQSLSDLCKTKLVRSYTGDRKTNHDKPWRALEAINFTFDILRNYGVYKDLQRHTPLTQMRQDLTAVHGYSVPQDVNDAGLGDRYRSVMDRVLPLWERIAKDHPKEAQYIIPHGMNIRFEMTLNAREAMVLTELRSQQNCHPDYRRVAQEMARQILKVHPILAPCFKFVDYNDYDLGRLKEASREGK